jgi:16S rRNA pseudouridine516 synthase
MTNKIRIDKLLSSLGYATRREVQILIKSGDVLENGEELTSTNQKVDPALVTLYNEPLDPTEILVMFHKPADYLCSHTGDQPLIYDLLPERWTKRRPIVTSVGRLDFDTTGLLILTDNGQIIHKLTSPKYKIPKVYEVELEKDLIGNEIEIFASGQVMLADEKTPLLPAVLEIIEPKKARLTLTEGRYHQVKRMFEHVNNQVLKLHRSQVGQLKLGDLAEGSFRNIKLEDVIESN